MVEHNLAKVRVASSSLVFRSFGALVQLVRIHACHAWGHGFESRTHRNMIEEKLREASFFMQEIAWAISAAGSEHLPYKQRVGGSNPSSPTNNNGMAP